MKSTLILFIWIILFISCNRQSGPEGSPAEKSTNTVQLADPLPSWRKGDTKNLIMNFVKAATKEGGPGFIPVSDRVAVFDNDGTLWAERPTYFELFFAFDRIRIMAKDHPEWKDQEPYRSVLNGDMESLASQGRKAILEILLKTHGGMSADEFEKIVEDWIGNTLHPDSGKPYNVMIYEPMLELLLYLKNNEFKTFIVSGGSSDFMRAWVDDTYGIPPYRVIGSSFKTEFRINNGKAEINRISELEFVDMKDGKPRAINRFIGKIPVIAIGNADGDMEMLLYSETKQPSIQLLVHHTDSVREWAYDRESKIGKLDLALDSAEVRGWRLIDMTEDWLEVFPD